MTERLKAPFPYFGGKSRIASLVWERIGDVDNFIEPFCGSAAVLLARPTPPKIETVNDADAYLANFWRATKYDPEAVAEWADWPVNEADLHARHRWLVLSEDARAFRKAMRTDPDYFDAKVAGWWCWGLCQWIGSGWCDSSQIERHQNQYPHHSESGAAKNPKSKVRIAGHNKGSKGKGVHSGGRKLDDRSLILGGGEGQYGHGVHAKGDVGPKMPNLSCSSGMDAGADVGEQLPLIGDPPRGEHRGAETEGRRPQGAGGALHYGQGIHVKGPAVRPQLADGRKPAPTARVSANGVVAVGGGSTCAQRRLWLLDWFGRLRDRLRTVRVCCGDWLRVCDSESVTTRLGVTGIFFDPPYGAKADRTARLYSTDSLTVAEDVLKYCLERGGNKAMRICLAGYAGEGHEELEKHGWDCVAWQAPGGYGNRSAKGRANAERERLWFSPFALQKELPLFDGISDG